MQVPEKSLQDGDHKPLFHHTGQLSFNAPAAPTEPEGR